MDPSKLLNSISSPGPKFKYAAKKVVKISLSQILFGICRNESLNHFFIIFVPELETSVRAIFVEARQRTTEYCPNGFA